VLQTLSEDVILSQNGALPNPYICSDHVYLVADIFGKLKPGIDPRFDGGIEDKKDITNGNVINKK